MKMSFLSLFLLSISAFAQFPGSGFPPGAGTSVGVGAANPSTEIASGTTVVVDVTLLNLASANSPNLVTGCWTGTGFSGGHITGTRTPLAYTITSITTTAVTFVFSSSSNVLCNLNSNGGTGATGITGSQGPPGADGASGSNGTDGKTIRNGSGVPSSGLGVNGDFYIDNTAHSIYGPKSAGAWGSSTSLIGPGGGAPAIQVGGSAVGSQVTLNFVQGTCASLSGVDASSVISVTIGVNTTTCPTKANLQIGASTTLTETSSSSSTYTFTMSPTLAAYPSGDAQLPLWTWRVGTAVSGGAVTGNVDGRGAKSIVMPDGSNPSATMAAVGKLLLVSYSSALDKIVIMGGEIGGTTVEALGTITTSPTFNGGGLTVKTFTATLGGNIDSCTLANFKVGEMVTIKLLQDGTGTRTMACSGITDLGLVSGIADKYDIQAFVATSATTLQAIGRMWCVTCDPAIRLPGLTSGTAVVKSDDVAGGTQRVPNVSGKFGIITGSPTDDDCGKIDVVSGVPSIASSGGPCQFIYEMTLSSSATDTYVGTTSPAMTAYVNNMRMLVKFNFASSGGATVDPDAGGALAAKNVYAANGTSDPATDNTATVILIYDTSLNSGAGGWKMPLIGGGATTPAFFDSVSLRGKDPICTSALWTTGGTIAPFNNNCGIKVTATSGGGSTAYAWANNQVTGSFNPTLSANVKRGIMFYVPNTLANADEYGVGFSKVSTGAQIPDNINYSSGNIQLVFIQGTDTTIKARSCAPTFTCQTPVDTGVTLTANTYFRVYFKTATAGTVFICANANADGTCAVSEVSMTAGAGMDNAPLWPSCSVFRGTSSDASIACVEISWDDTVNYN